MTHRSQKICMHSHRGKQINSIKARITVGGMMSYRTRLGEKVPYLGLSIKSEVQIKSATAHPISRLDRDSFGDYCRGMTPGRVKD